MKKNFNLYVIAVTLSLRPTKQPNILATSLTNAVKTAMMNKEQKKLSQPWNIWEHHPAGGTNANITFHGNEIKWFM